MTKAATSIFMLCMCLAALSCKGSEPLPESYVDALADAEGTIPKRDTAVAMGVDLSAEDAPIVDLLD